MSHTYPSCPRCGEYELYSLLSYRQLPTPADYMKAPTACYVCGSRFEEPPIWIREHAGSYLVRVSIGANPTQVNIDQAVAIIPDHVRQGKTVQFVEEIWPLPYHWFRIAILELKV